jgi:hypothetical protein
VANTFTEVIPKLLAQGLLALRQLTPMPRIVNSGYSAMAGNKGDTIDVPIPSAIAAQAVAPDNVPPATADMSPTSVAVPLDQWYEAPFYLTDKDFLEVMNGTIPMQASEAIKALANQVNGHIYGMYKGVYGVAGAAGTTPFGTDLSEFLEARKVLTNQLAPKSPRRVVIDPDAEANALALRAFQDASFRGDTAGILEGEIGRKLGSDWYSMQDVPTHVPGTGTGILAAALGVIGNKSIAIDTGSGTANIGDIITFADHAQTYTLTAASTDVSTGTLSFEPGLKTAVPDTTAITIMPAHVVNLAFHRDAFAFATRPFAGMDPMGLGSYMSTTDPESGLALRIEVTREHKRTRFSYDILWGAQLVRRELAVRLLG